MAKKIPLIYYKKILLKKYNQSQILMTEKKIDNTIKNVLNIRKAKYPKLKTTLIRIIQTLFLKL